MISSLILLILLYLTPVGGYFLAKQCGKEAQQGRRLFERLSLILILIAALWMAYYVHYLLLVLALALYLPLYYKARDMAGPSTMGFLFGLSTVHLNLTYEISLFALLYGLVYGTLHWKEKWKLVLVQYLPFLVLGGLGMALAASFK
ncbi:MAG TPA: hypothetical protein VJG90_00150 [Candidatus Nanoarchaeia archaeon]|nr:hypothetical protein [Candidatus Nanoarchaeia archaeon]